MNFHYGTGRCGKPQQARGFTLIELMITVVIIAILAAVAFPSFMDSIRKSRRSEAFTALNNVQQAQERFRSNNNAYTTNLTASPTATTPGLGLAATTPGGYYTISVNNAGPTSYDVSATAVSGTSQANDGTCSKLGVRLNGGNLEYASSTTSGTLSWSNSNPCWSR